MFEVTVRFSFESFCIRDNSPSCLIDRMRNLLPYFYKAFTKIEFLDLVQLEYLRFCVWFLESFDKIEDDNEFVEFIKSRPKIFYIEDKLSIDYHYEEFENN